MSSRMPRVMPLLPSAALQFSASGRTVPSLARVSQATLFERKKKYLGSINPGPGAAVPYTSPRPSTTLVKALEAASFWHWARWRVLGGAWLKYIILFQFSFFFFGWIPELQVQPAWLSLCPRACSQVYINQPFLYCKANHSTWICCDWLTSFVSMSDYIGTLQLLFLLFPFNRLWLASLKGQAACLVSQTSRRLNRNSHPFKPPAFYAQFLTVFKECAKSNFSLSSHLSCVFSAVSTSHTWLNRNTLWMNQDNWAFSKANRLVSLSSGRRKFTSSGLVSLSRISYGWHSVPFQ